MEKTFDPTAAYVVATSGLMGGHTLVATAPVSIVEEPKRPGEFTADQAEQLLRSGKIQLATDVRPTPVETPEQEVVRLTDLEPMGDDTFLLRAPWIESETIKGEEKARARFDEVTALGLERHRATAKAAASTLSEANANALASTTLSGGDGFSIAEDGSNGYYTLTKPDGTTERVRGKAKAEERLAELRTEAAGTTTVPTAPSDVRTAIGTTEPGDEVVVGDGESDNEV